MQNFQVWQEFALNDINVVFQLHLATAVACDSCGCNMEKILLS